MIDKHYAVTTKMLQTLFSLKKSFKELCQIGKVFVEIFGFGRVEVPQICIAFS